MKKYDKFVLLLCLIMAWGSVNVIADTCTTQNSGAWDDNSTWSCGQPPQDGDDVVIAHDIIYYGDLSISPNSLTINNERSLKVKGDLTIPNIDNIKMNWQKAMLTVDGSFTIENINNLECGDYSIIDVGSSFTIRVAASFSMGINSQISTNDDFEIETVSGEFSTNNECVFNIGSDMIIKNVSDYKLGYRSELNIGQDYVLDAVAYSSSFGTEIVQVVYGDFVVKNVAEYNNKYSGKTVTFGDFLADNVPDVSIVGHFYVHENMTLDCVNQFTMDYNSKVLVKKNFTYVNPASGVMTTSFQNQSSELGYFSVGQYVKVDIQSVNYNCQTNQGVYFLHIGDTRQSMIDFKPATRGLSPELDSNDGTNCGNYPDLNSPEGFENNHNDDWTNFFNSGVILPTYTLFPDNNPACSGSLEGFSITGDCTGTNLIITGGVCSDFNASLDPIFHVYWDNDGSQKKIDLQDTNGNVLATFPVSVTQTPILTPFQAVAVNP